MLLDELDRIARERLESIFRYVEESGMPLDQKATLRADLTALKDILGTLDVQGLQHVNEALQSVMGLLQPGNLLVFEPVSGLLLSLLKFLGSGGGSHGEEREGSRRPGPGMDR